LIFSQRDRDLPEIFKRLVALARAIDQHSCDRCRPFFSSTWQTYIYWELHDLCRLGGDSGKYREWTAAVLECAKQFDADWRNRVIGKAIDFKNYEFFKAMSALPPLPIAFDRLIAECTDQARDTLREFQSRTS
jgi:hypothetical protein